MSHLFWILAAFALLLPVMAPLAPADAAEGSLPEGGRALMPPWDAQAGDLIEREGMAAREAVGVEGQAFDAATRVVVRGEMEKPHYVQLKFPLTAAIEQGDAILVRLHARTQSTTDESGDGTIGVVVERNSERYEKVIESAYYIGSDWTRIDVPAQPSMDLARGEGQLNLRLGYREQTLDIAGVEVINFGPSADVTSLPRMALTYRGQAADAPWRAAAAERIEQHRKADLTVRVIDAAGQPVQGATVRVRQTRHAFGFGAAVTAKSLMAEGEDTQRYREIVEKYFNKVVFENDLKWGGFNAGKNNDEGTYRHVWLDPAMDWVRERDIEIRGHYLMWAPVGRWQPEGVRDASPEVLKRATFDHISEKLAWTRDRCGEWDAVNHIIGWGETYADRMGGPEIYADTIKLGRELAPHAEMWINEGQILAGGGRIDEYLTIVDTLVELGAKPDGVGFMGHFRGGSLTPPAELYNIIDRYATAHPDIKLQLTEFDVDVTTDDKVQAEYLRDVMTIAFSHPNFEAIVMWGFWEGRHWRPDAALWRRDWTIKPAGEAWLDLVYRQWWTTLDGTTDSAGTYSARGFMGEYSVEAETASGTASATFTLSAGGEDVTVQLD